MPDPLEYTGSVFLHVPFFLLILHVFCDLVWLFSSSKLTLLNLFLPSINFFLSSIQSVHISPAQENQGKEFTLVYLIAYCKLIWECPDTILVSFPSFPLPLQLIHQIHELFYNYYCVLYTHAHISKCLNVHIWVSSLWIGGSVLKVSLSFLWQPWADCL